MYWLITYQQWTGSQHLTANHLTELPPAIWLRDQLQHEPAACTVLINAIEIEEVEYEELINYL